LEDEADSDLDTDDLSEPDVWNNRDASDRNGLNKDEQK